MNNAKYKIAVVCGLLLLCIGAGVQAQEVDPFWYPPCTQQSRIEPIEIAQFNAKPLVLGDAKLGLWAVQQSDAALRMDEHMLLNWLQVVQMYRVSEAEPTLARMVEQMMRKRPKSSLLTQGVYSAFVTVATKRSERLLAKMLRSPLLATGQAYRADEQKYRLYAAARLALINDHRGRDYLVKQMDSDIVKSRDSFPDSIRVVGQVYEPKLLKQIESLKDRPRYKAQAQLQRTVDGIVEAMQFKALSLQEIRSKVKPVPGDSSYSKYLMLLAHRGELGDIKLIETLDLSHLNDQRELLKADAIRSRALLMLRCRLWAELAN